MQKTDKALSFIDHLDELRYRLLICLAVTIAASLGFYCVVDAFLAVIIKPVGRLVFTAPAEAFTARLWLTLLGGFIFSLPVVIYQIWRFVAIGLTEKERKYIIFFGPASGVLFIIGGLFAYFFMIPISVRFLLGFSSGMMIPMITVSHYINFVVTILLACGVVFELPLILLFLTKTGVATPEFLRQKRRHAIILILIVSAVMTPPDVITQLLMAAPLILLYEIGVWCSCLAGGQRPAGATSRDIPLA
jgi:sec-independent protein translocase protein TatC